MNMILNSKRKKLSEEPIKDKPNTYRSNPLPQQKQLKNCIFEQTHKQKNNLLSCVESSSSLKVPPLFVENVTVKQRKLLWYSRLRFLLPLLLEEEKHIFFRYQIFLPLNLVLSSCLKFWIKYIYSFIKKEVNTGVNDCAYLHILLIFFL